MRYLNFSVGKAELLAMMLFTVGCIADHITTYYGLAVPSIEEANPVVLFMIGAGIWNAIELLIILLGTTSGFISSSTKSRSTVAMSAISLMVVGLIRLYAAFHNVVLISNVGRLFKNTFI